MDLNGTILHRLTHVPEMKAFRTHPIVLEKQIKPDVTVNKAKIVYRPHAKSFLEHVLKHFDVAVWTSSQSHNALPMVHHSFFSLLDFSSVLEEAHKRQITVRQVLLGPSDKGAESLKERLLEETKGRPKLQFIWTQDECDTVKLPKGSESEDTVNTFKYVKPIRKKNLQKIYKEFFDYTPANTLIIDDTDAKLADHLANHLKVDEFNVIDPEIDFTQDVGLLKLKKFLEKLVRDDPNDVRTFLASHSLHDF